MKSTARNTLIVPLIAAAALSVSAQTPPPARPPGAAEYPPVRQARNITHVAIWNMPAAPEKVFPLLCPVREYDWIPWWRAEMVHTVSGVAEENCIFRTNIGPAAGLTWVCTRYEPARQIEYTCFAPDKLIVRLKIVLTRTTAGTQMEWTRSWLSLGAAGDEAIRLWSATDYEHMMAVHEKEMEHYLRTGHLLTAARH
jgi:hypothetical protein